MIERVSETMIDSVEKLLKISELEDTNVNLKKSDFNFIKLVNDVIAKNSYLAVKKGQILKWVSNDAWGSSSRPAAVLNN